METPRPLHIWDPDGLNPYAQEVFALLADQHVVADIWLPRSAQLVLSPTHSAHVRARLGGAVGRDGFVRHVLLRLFMPLAVAALVVFRRDRLLVAWIRGPYEGLVFGIAARLGWVATVHHNPTESRRGGRFFAAALGFLLAGSTRVILHSDLLLTDVDRRLVAKTVIAEHPPYERWVAAYGRPAPEAHATTTLLFLGVLRADKGLADFLSLGTMLDASRYRLLVAGKGELSESDLRQIADSAVPVTLRVQRLPLAQDDIAAALAEADLLVAPYSAATVSGTIVMARSCGLPVIGYDSGALAGFLTEAALTGEHTPASLAERIDSFSEEPFETHRHGNQAARARAAREWLEAVGT